MRLKIGKFEFEGTAEELEFLLRECPELLGILRRRAKKIRDELLKGKQGERE